jgi:hypothetical protein
MQPIEQALVSFFVRVARKDTPQLERLKRDQHFLVGRERWCFTLPELYSFLQQDDDVFLGVDYRQFRRAIFNCPVNRAKVDQSGYALVWQTSG